MDAEGVAIVRAMMAPDDFGRIDVLSTLFSLPELLRKARHDGSLVDCPVGRTAAAASTVFTVPPPPPDDWKTKTRTKTVAAVLVMCLNVGIDPPGATKVSVTEPA